MIDYYALETLQFVLKTKSLRLESCRVTMDPPKTRSESKKDSRSKRDGKDRLGSGKGTRQREAIAAAGIMRPKGK